MHPVKILLDRHFPYEESAFVTAHTRCQRVALQSWLPHRWAVRLHALNIYRQARQGQMVLGNRRTTLILGLLFLFYKPRHVVLVGYEMVFSFRSTTLRTQAAIFLWKLAMRKVDRLVVQSEEEKAYLSNLFRVSPTLFYTIPFLSETARFVGANPEGFLFSAGRMERDFVTVLQAVRNTDIPTVIVADGALRSLLTPLASSNVQLLFDVTKERYLRLLQEAQMVVVSLNAGPVSRGQVVLLEAMSYGKPVIYTQTAGAEEYVRHGETGWLVPAQSPHALQQMILTVFEDVPTLLHVGQQAYQEQRACFSPEVFYRNYRQFICSMLRTESSANPNRSSPQKAVPSHQVPL